MFRAPKNAIIVSLSIRGKKRYYNRIYDRRLNIDTGEVEYKFQCIPGQEPVPGVQHHWISNVLIIQHFQKTDNNIGIQIYRSAMNEYDARYFYPFKLPFQIIGKHIDKDGTQYPIVRYAGYHPVFDTVNLSIEQLQQARHISVNPTHLEQYYHFFPTQRGILLSSSLARSSKKKKKKKKKPPVKNNKKRVRKGYAAPPVPPPPLPSPTYSPIRSSSAKKLYISVPKVDEKNVQVPDVERAEEEEFSDDIFFNITDLHEDPDAIVEVEYHEEEEEEDYQPEDDLDSASSSSSSSVSVSLSEDSDSSSISSSSEVVEKAPKMSKKKRRRLKPRTGVHYRVGKSDKIHSHDDCRGIKMAFTRFGSVSRPVYSESPPASTCTYCIAMSE